MPKKSEGGWSGIGMANSGIDPTHVYFLNDHPTQIPPSEILGPVVQNCLYIYIEDHKKVVGQISNVKVFTVDPYFKVIFFTGHSQSAKISTFGHF